MLSPRSPCQPGGFQGQAEDTQKPISRLQASWGLGQRVLTEVGRGGLLREEEQKQLRTDGSWGGSHSSPGTKGQGKGWAGGDGRRKKQKPWNSTCVHREALSSHPGLNFKAFPTLKAAWVSTLNVEMEGWGIGVAAPALPGPGVSLAGQSLMIEILCQRLLWPLLFI